MGKVLFRMASHAEASFGWPCGGTFIPNRAKCWTDPKTGRRLKVPINYQTYQKITGSKGKAAQKLYKDREQAIRDRRRAAVPGWKGKEADWKQQSKDTLKKILSGEELIIDTDNGTNRLKYIKGKDVNYLKIYKGDNENPSSSPLMTQENLEKYIDDLYNPKVAKYYTIANPRFVDNKKPDRSKTPQQSQGNSIPVFTRDELQKLDAFEREKYKKILQPVQDKYLAKIESHPNYPTLKKKIDASIARTYDGKGNPETERHLKKYYSTPEGYIDHIEYNSKSKLSSDLNALQKSILRDVGVPLKLDKTFRGNAIDWNGLILKESTDTNSKNTQSKQITPERIDKANALSQQKKRSPSIKNLPKQKQVDLKKELSSALDDVLAMSKAGGTTQTLYAVNVGGATDRAAQLLRADTDSAQWKNDPNYQINTVSEAITKLRYKDDEQKRVAADKAYATAQNFNLKDIEKVNKFNKTTLELAENVYKNKMSDAAKNKWASHEYIGIFDDTSEDGISKRKFEQLASKSSYHARIANDLADRIQKQLDTGDLKLAPRTKRKPRSPVQSEFGRGDFAEGRRLKRRLKSRKKICCCQAKFNSTYTRRTKKGKTVVVRKGRRSKDNIKSRKRLIGGAGLALSALTGFTPIDYYRWKAATSS
ncbi:MAG: hypothetical protein RMY28_009545 [Nostoc sp. ChiSLP01]|nr:hypothetical protein [Nostoc sp. CmiSLP01]MDZ8285201.1 hypothetical protein [Nostoc sp. ChiSLP01]